MSFQDDSSSISEIIRVNPVDLAICIVGIPQYLSNYQAKLAKYQANGDLIIQASPKQLKALLKNCLIELNVATLTKMMLESKLCY